MKRYHDPDDNAVFSMMGELERLKQVQDCPNVIQLLGVGRVASEDWCLVFELADRVLTGHDPGSELGAAISRDIGAALECLHARGLIHSDVAPNNILQVGAVWKLADFDSCVAIGSEVRGVSTLARYVAPGHVLGAKAETYFDTFGLDAIVQKYGGGS